MQGRACLAADVAFLVVLWILAASRHFDGFGVVLAALWTVRVLLFEWHGYRLVLRGWQGPSKNPDDYR